MRTMLLLISVSMAAISIPAGNAEACGGDYWLPPQAHRIASVQAPGSRPDTVRRFVLLDADAAVPDQVAWTEQVPDGHAIAKLAHATWLAQPVTVTLIGPSGARQVTSREQVFVGQERDAPALALQVEVPRDAQLVLALDGAWQTRDLVWMPLERTQRTDPQWVLDQGVAPSIPSWAPILQVSRTQIEAISLYPLGSSEMVTLVRHGNTRIGSYRGTAFGAFQLGTRLLLVLSRGDQLELVVIA
ncbi:MAG: hypothetical protein ACTHU0_31065 [Kofleriaceae bacterium]